MRRYKTYEYVESDFEGKPTGVIYKIPCAHALLNFEKYLNKKELAFYNELLPIQRLSIGISVDPFNALKLAIESKKRTHENYKKR